MDPGTGVIGGSVCTILAFGGFEGARRVSGTSPVSGARGSAAAAAAPS